MFHLARPRLHSGSALLAAAAVGVIVAGCAQGGGAATPTPAPAASQPTGSAAAAASGEVYTVATRQGTLGSFLTGDDGKTLYVLTKDSSGTSTCTGDCAQTWPPFTLESGESTVAGTGVTGTLGTITRPDGSVQVSINGLPLYYYSGDTAAGETNGQGINNVWYVAGPDGKPVTSAGSTGGYGY